MKTNKLIKTIILLLSFLLSSSILHVFGQGKDIKKKEIFEGFDIIKGFGSFGGRSFGVVGIIIDPHRYQLVVSGLDQNTLSGYSLPGFLKRTNSLAAISGGPRSSQNLPIGLVLENRRLTHQIDKESSKFEYILTIRNNVVNIIHRDRYDSYVAYDYALQSGPLIVERGGKNAINEEEMKRKEKHERGFIAIQKETGNIVLAITGEVYLYDLAEFLSTPSPRGLNCDIALNLEGGGKVGFFISLPIPEWWMKGYKNFRLRRPNAITVKRISEE
ncbi:MAG: phosphodiester glycosidase family protein [Candidatus Aminicenantes bacterium]|nr:MAG: phosphodiester glycosidase family protein [Candidatus Aminicenantes bacterium]